MLRFKFHVFIGMISLAILGCHSDKKQEVKILFLGDILLDRGVGERIEHLGIDHLFQPEMDSLFSQHDIIIGNLECPATHIDAPINKQFIFKADPAHLQALNEHGITHLNMANNHAMDQGRAGLVDTEANIRKFGMIPTGYGTTHEQACQPVLLVEEPRPIYLISSLQVPSENWTFLANEPCVCEASTSEIAAEIQALKSNSKNALVIVQLHWGAEHQVRPLMRQKEGARQLIDAGADCIVGHHPHVVQSIEWHQGKPIYYSIGNFIFDQDRPINTKGIIVQVSIRETDIQFDTIPYQIVKSVPQLN